MPKPIAPLMQRWPLHLRSTVWRWSLKAPAMSHGLLQRLSTLSRAWPRPFRKGKATL